MEQRCEPRFSANQSILLTILGENECQVPARIKNISGRGLGLEVSVAVQPGAALKIEAPDAIYLAEAVFCRKDPHSYFVGAALEQMLSGLAELGRILQQFQDEPLGMQQQYTVHERAK